MGGGGQPTRIIGLSGGTDGRVIILKADSPNLNINLENQSSSSIPENRISFGGGNGGVNGFGAITLIYISDVSRWQILNLHQ